MERESVRNSAENSGALVATTPTPAPPAPAPVHAYTAPTHIEVRGARVHNLKNINVDIPLGCLVGIAGVSGSGKSSLALGTLYAEGSRRYLDALSTYTRRRIGQVGRATVDEVRHVPAALALRQRPGIPGVHSTFGTSTELLNYLRLMFSRLGSHQCPHCGTHVPPSMDVALMRPTTCPSCGQEFYGPGAEDLAFNSAGACTTCGGTGIVRTVDESTLVPDESLSIEEGAVASWQQLMWKLMRDIAREMGVRTDVPFRDLTPEEREIVFHGPAEKHHMFYQSSKTGDVGEMDFTYFNAVYTVENALSKVKDEKGLARLAKFLKEDVCPDCHGTRLNARARGPVIDGMNLGEATRMTLDELAAWVPGVPALMPEAMRPMAQSIVAEMAEPIERLKQLGLGYLSLDRASSTLSTGERQRVQLARAVRNRTCGVLYVLDEPSIGLHPSNVEGLLGVMDDLLADGNSVVLVDHDVRVLRHADHLVEIGPGSGTAGGSVIAQGSVEEVERSPATRIGPFLSGARRVRVRERAAADEVFARGAVRLETGAIHTVKPLAVEVPRGRLTAVTGVSGSGKTTLVLESLIPGLRAAIAGEALPGHVRSVDPRRPQARAPHRRHAHRRQCALDGGHLLGRSRRPAPRLCQDARGARARPQGGRVLVQHGEPQVPHLRWHGPDLARRAVFARCGHSLPRLPGRALPSRGARHQARRRPQPARAHVVHGGPGARGARRPYAQKRARQATDPLRPGARLPYARRGHAGALGRRGPAPQARERAHARPGRRSLCV